MAGSSVEALPFVTSLLTPVITRHPNPHTRIVTPLMRGTPAVAVLTATVTVAVLTQRVNALAHEPTSFHLLPYQAQCT